MTSTEKFCRPRSTAAEGSRLVGDQAPVADEAVVDLTAPADGADGDTAAGRHSSAASGRGTIRCAAEHQHSARVLHCSHRTIVHGCEHHGLLAVSLTGPRQAAIKLRCRSHLRMSKPVAATVVSRATCKQEA